MKNDIDTFGIKIYPNISNKMDLVYRIINKIISILFVVVITSIIVGFMAYIPNESEYIEDCIRYGYTLEEAEEKVENMSRISDGMIYIFKMFIGPFIVGLIFWRITSFQKGLLYKADREVSSDTKVIITNFDGLFKLYAINPNSYKLYYYRIYREFKNKHGKYTNLYVCIFDIRSIIRFKIFKWKILNHKNKVKFAEYRKGVIEDLEYLINSDLKAIKNKEGD